MPSAEHRLGLRTLFIVPSRFGILWLGAALLLLLVGIQTSSNSSLLLGFLLLGLMLLAMFITHDNLQGIKLRCGEPKASFAAEPTSYPLVIHSPSPRHRIQLRFQGGERHALEQLSDGDTIVALHWTPLQRGWQYPPRLLLDTVAPLGLFICWARWTPNTPQLIWPARRRGPICQTKRRPRRDGLEEWQDLRPLRPGERRSLIDWANAAKGRPLLAKQFSNPDQTEHILSPSPDTLPEQALEHLSERIWQLHHRGERYGLTLGGRTIEPGSGVKHRNRCLELLATA